MSTSVPWFRITVKDAENWIRHIKQKIKRLKSQGKSYVYLVHEDLTEAIDALHRAKRLKSKRKYELD